MTSKTAVEESIPSTILGPATLNFQIQSNQRHYPNYRVLNELFHTFVRHIACQMLAEST